MYLKKIEVQGFKSFPDKVALEFNEGITSIVGPNGSGKSNISDAIRWVLGEQSIKSLRGNKMEDVIFAGTDTRKQMGFAEVTLVLDNSDGSFPVDYAEISVTRRVFRSGESEYQINKTNCRLKDIYELFMDTGIGKDGYSVIGQGKIDEILSTKPEERRNIFEEASGIMKYKTRKEEAERKLELTRINLVRINDIVCELEIQLEPLKEQSETAKRYLSLREELKEIEVGLFIDSIDKLKVKLKEFTDKMEQLENDLTQGEIKRAEISKGSEDTSIKIKEQREKLEAIRQSIAEIDVETEKYNSEIKVSGEKIENNTNNILRIDAEITDFQNKIQQMKVENDSRAAELEGLLQKVKDGEEQLLEYQRKIEGLDGVIGEGEKRIQELNDGIFENMSISSDLKNRSVSIKSVLDNIEKRKQDIARAEQTLKAEEKALAEKVSGLETEIKNINDCISSSSEELNSIISKRNEGETRLRNLNENLQKKRAELQHAKSRHGLLTDMEKRFEGYNRSVREILLACESSQELNKGVHGTLAQLISVNKEYETAIETALGGALQNIVTSTEEDAKRIIEYLKKNKLGRATFLPISSVKYREKSIDNEVKSMPGYISTASKIIKCDDKYRDIVESLLGRVVIAENLDCGIAIARKFNYSFRIVTLEGEILNTSGALTGGSTEGREHGILGRSREIEELKKKVQDTEKQAEDIEKEITALTTELKKYDEDIKNSSETIKRNEMVKIRIESEIKQYSESVMKIKTQLELHDAESKELEDRKSATEKEYQDALKLIEEKEINIISMKEKINEVQEASKNERQNRELLGNEVMSVRLSLNSLNENIKTLKENIDRTASEILSAENSIKKREAEKEKNMKDIESCRSLIAELEQKIKDILALKDSKMSEEKDIYASISGSESDITRMNEEIKNIEKDMLLLQEEKNRLEVKKAKIDMEIESIQNRMWDEYELTYSNAEKFRKDIGSVTQAQKKVNELKDGIRQLGPVNIAAIDDYIKTKQRYEFLSTQKDDLEKTEDKLKKVISEIVALMKKQFSEQFALINENFNIVFRELFGGGRAELKIEDKDNILESGIEIEVQPPGKKLQNMMLLSGGEKAFTAIALLFAILRLKPAPFCVLDEIEAALDEANVYRFAEYLSRYTDKTQFVVITHRKGTMEISDTLYGVTMQEQGVSKIVSLNVKENVS